MISDEDLVVKKETLSKGTLSKETLSKVFLGNLAKIFRNEEHLQLVGFQCFASLIWNFSFAFLGYCKIFGKVFGKVLCGMSHVSKPEPCLLHFSDQNSDYDKLYFCSRH